MSYVTAGERTALSFAQHGMWVTERLGGAGTAYHMPLAIGLDGPLDTEALLGACADTLARHEVLGAAVGERDGEPFLVTAAAVPPITYLRSGGEAALREAAESPFDPESGPLARFTLVELAPERHVLLFVAHHLVFDGMSKDVLVRDLAELYRARRLGGPAELPPIAGSYGAAAELERGRVAELLPAAAAYWQDRWRDPARVVLPGVAAGVPRRPEPGESVELTLTGEVAAAAAALGVTRFEALLTAVHALLAAYGNETAVVAVDLSTRTPGTEDQVGLFVNELPVVSEPAPGTTLGELAAGIRARLREIYRFRAVPVSRAIGGISPRAALAVVSVSYRRRSAGPVFTGLDTTVEWMMSNHAVRNTLHLQAVDGPDGLAVALRHDPRQLAPDQAVRLADDLRAVLGAAPGTPLGALPIEPVTPPAEAPAAPPEAADEVDAELAEQVRQIWQEVLRIEDIRLDEDLYDLGGHSLTVTQIAARIEKRLGVEVPLDVFLDDPTISGVVASIRATRA